ncbi:MAG: hypothetical protein HY898_08175 [Deltaproteobacteria bacterium]|nr:hypothetical protein [Deltaproteobacteria bacterium]
MRLVHLAMILLPSLVAAGAACNFIIDAQLKDYGSECKFEGRETACGQCIANACAAHINVACKDQYDTDLSRVEACAKDPNAKSYYDDFPCETFNVDGGASGNDRQDLSVCVRDSCIQGGGGPCKATCAVDAGASACASCVNTKCAQEMIPMCDTRKSNGTFDDIESCAADPDVDKGNYNCNPFRREDGGVEQGTTIQTAMHNFKVCVRDKCMTPEVSPCNTCPLKDKNGYPLEASECGKCIQGSCLTPLIRCCADDPEVASYTQLVHSWVASCGFPDKVAEDCKKVLAVDAGAGEGCLFDLPDCMRKNCSAQCSN